MFVSEPISPLDAAFDPAIIARGEPTLPTGFKWRDRELIVATLRRTWRGTKVDRGETYVKRHYWEFLTPQAERIVVYFERQALRAAPRWWLYTIETQPPPR